MKLNEAWPVRRWAGRGVGRVLAAGLVWLLTGCQSPGPLVIAPGEVANPPPGHYLANQHADPHSTINRQTVRRLRLTWRFHDRDYVSHTPLVADGRVFFADWGGVVSAVDARTGWVSWMTEAEQPRRERPWHGFCGTGAIADGRLFEASAEGDAFAFDTGSGRLLWRQRFTFRPHAGCRGGLLYHEGLLYIPVSPVEDIAPNSGFRGGVVALDVSDGHVVWSRELIEVVAGATNGFAGVPVVGGFALDKDADSLFFATGDHVPFQVSQYSDSIVALDARNAAVLWSFQPRHWATNSVSASPQLDHGFVAAPQLFEANVDGQARKLVGAGDKSGQFWVLDRDTGKLVWNTRVGSGGSSIVADASIGAGNVFVWAKNAIRRRWLGTASASITALDAAGGEPRWLLSKAPLSADGSAGFMAGDVYLLASLDGRIRAYRAADGKEIWTSPRIGPAPGSLAVANSALFCTTGVPPSPGRLGKGGDVIAFSLGVESSPPLGRTHQSEGKRSADTGETGAR